MLQRVVPGDSPTARRMENALLSLILFLLTEKSLAVSYLSHTHSTAYLSIFYPWRMVKSSKGLTRGPSKWCSRGILSKSANFCCSAACKGCSTRCSVKHDSLKFQLLCCAQVLDIHYPRMSRPCLHACDTGEAPNLSVDIACHRTPVVTP